MEPDTTRAYEPKGLDKTPTNELVTKTRQRQNATSDGGNSEGDLLASRAWKAPSVVQAWNLDTHRHSVQTTVRRRYKGSLVILVSFRSDGDGRTYIWFPCTGIKTRLGTGMASQARLRLAMQPSDTGSGLSSSSPCQGACTAVFARSRCSKSDP
jgi:hypothetical protein